MPFYNRQFLSDGPAGKRTLERLAALRASLDAEIPQRSQEETLLLATWNLRDFDKPSFGQRSEEAMHYLAEVCARFDLIAIQEVYRDLGGLKRLMALLGGTWDFLVTDTGEGGRKRRADGLRLRHAQGHLRRAGRRDRAAPDPRRRRAGAGPAARTHAVHRRLPQRLDRLRAVHRPHPLRHERRRQPAPRRGDPPARGVPQAARHRPVGVEPQPDPAGRLQHLRPRRRHDAGDDGRGLRRP